MTSDIMRCNNTQGIVLHSSDVVIRQYRLKSSVNANVCRKVVSGQRPDCCH